MNIRGIALSILITATFAACTSQEDLVDTAAQSGLSGKIATSEAPDQVLAWNVTALQIFPSQNPLFAFRWLAMLHSSIFDAVNGVSGNYEAFIVNESAPAGADTMRRQLGLVTTR